MRYMLIALTECCANLRACIKLSLKNQKKYNTTTVPSAFPSVFLSNVLLSSLYKRAYYSTKMIRRIRYICLRRNRSYYPRYSLVGELLCTFQIDQDQ